MEVDQKQKRSVKEAQMQRKMTTAMSMKQEEVWWRDYLQRFKLFHTASSHCEQPLTLLKKRDSDVSAESTVSSSIQLGLTKLLLGKPVWEADKPPRPWMQKNSCFWMTCLRSKVRSEVHFPTAPSFHLTMFSLCHWNESFSKLCGHLHVPLSAKTEPKFIH